MTVRARFAPSPTGNVHIGNIRAAIFNWLFARRNKGVFLLRIEDTDLERSTDAAIKTLLECMSWLGLDYDGEPVRQTSLLVNHKKAAEKMLSEGRAYYPPPAADAKDGAKPPLLFRIPVDCAGMPFVREAGPCALDTDPATPFQISHQGVTFAQLSQKGAKTSRSATLAGFRQMKIYDAAGKVIFELEPVLDKILKNELAFTIENASRATYLRREVFFEDIVKGTLSKPLDSIKDFVIMRGDGSPVFHMANVSDDITQQITHIIRGDDHVENTYRHLFLFNAMGAEPPRYGHLPMIVNSAGKPYSKRDGDAYVGEFREKGYLPETLFNYLALLGWSPGDNREKLSRQELTELFSLERVKSAPAQFDMDKLFNLNGLYMNDLPEDVFLEKCRAALAGQTWADAKGPDYFRKAALLMRSRTKLFTHCAAWRHFFSEEHETDVKASQKFLKAPPMPDALKKLAAKLAAHQIFDEKSIEDAIRATEAECGVQAGKMNQPLRLAVTGSSVGAGIYETMALLGKDTVVKRLEKAALT
jgi:glutamyl-tRNA synthetase